MSAENTGIVSFDQPDVLNAHVQAELDQAHRDILPTRAGIVGCIYLVLAGVNFYSFEGQLGFTLTLMAGAVALVGFSLAAFYRLCAFDPRLANLFTFVELAILQADGMPFMVLTQDVMNSYGVFVMILSAGIFITRLDWLLVTILMVAGSWGGVIFSFDVAVAGTREGLMLISSVSAALMFYYLRRRAATRLGEAQLGQRAYQSQLENAIEKIETLSGLLPICANCKKIRDDSGHWEEVEVYMRDRTRADFSHSVCPSCTEVLYPGR